VEIFASTGVRSPDRPARCEQVYPLSYPCLRGYSSLQVNIQDLHNLPSLMSVSKSVVVDVLH
jgi:hypothetical protein